MTTSLPLSFLTITSPGLDDVKMRWWRDLMPSNACRRKKGEKCLAQSYCLTITSPSSFPTSWAWLMEAEFSTTFTRSCRHPTSVLLNRCFRRPNAQSGANLVWPTIMKLISTCLLRPAITRHAKYCIIKSCKHRTGWYFCLHLPIFILGATVIGVQMQICCPKAVVFQEVMQEADHTIASLADTHAFIHQVVHQVVHLKQLICIVLLLVSK